ncbi:transposase [Sinorhizobium sp. 22678]|uniref:transposase n=1 Tax=Sinorhizobium sp. 22678 TaxID=3453955 RepID=UPI003F86068B
MPGIGPLIATALEALAPSAETFPSGRGFCSLIGLTPIQRSTGGKERVGLTSRMGEGTLRRLLITASSALSSAGPSVKAYHAAHGLIGCLRASHPCW